MRKREKIITLFKPIFKKKNKFEISAYTNQILFLNLNKMIFFNNNLLKNAYKKKYIKKKKKICTILFKRRNFFIVLHIYIANKLVYVTNFEENSKIFKFRKFIKFYIFKIIKKLFYYINAFNKIVFILKFIKKTRRIKKKVNLFKKNDKKIKKKYKRTKTFINGLFFKKLVLCSSLLKKVQVKLLYNLSHSFAREKLKKKRRK